MCDKEMIKKITNLAITWSNVFNNRMFLSLPLTLSRKHHHYLYCMYERVCVWFCSHCNFILWWNEMKYWHTSVFRSCDSKLCVHCFGNKFYTLRVNFTAIECLTTRWHVCAHIARVDKLHFRTVVRELISTIFPPQILWVRSALFYTVARIC